MDINFKTKYGANIPVEIMIKYFDKLTGRIFKILPMSEEKFTTLNLYVENLLLELSGGGRLITNDLKLFELMIHLEVLSFVFDNEKKLKSQIFKCVKLCKKISDEIRFEQSKQNKTTIQNNLKGDEEDE
jgi:hypothetical protein